MYSSEISSCCDWDAFLHQLVSIRLTLVAQHVKLLCNHKRWRQSPELISRSQQWRGSWFFPSCIIWCVIIPESLHALACEPGAFLQCVVRLSVKICVGNWIE